MQEVAKPPMMTTEDRSRSRSRGREAMMSTGRGGAGNMRDASESRNRGMGDAMPSAERGRTVAPPLTTNYSGLTHSGRGGAGNIRSPSRDPARDAAEEAYEAQLVRKRRIREAEQTHSTGRGGVGNMSSSRSRSRSASGNRKIDHGLEAGLAHGAGGVAGASEYRASGRGGWGNMHAANGEDDDRERLRKLDEEDDRVRHSYEERQGPDTYNSAGRGGAGNIHPRPSTSTVDSDDTIAAAKQQHQSTPVHHGRSTGRGGAGNYSPAQKDTAEDDGARGRGESKGPLETMKDLFRGVLY